VRNDPWFIKEADFPVVSPFLTEVNPPTEEEYARAAETVCDLDERETICWANIQHKP
jgi:hypothetical protein